MEVVSDERLIDPELFLGSDPDAYTLDGLLSLLNTHYWWNDDWPEPEQYITDVLETLDREQLNGVFRVIHDQLPYCSLAEDCAGSVQACIEKELQTVGRRPEDLHTDTYLNAVFATWLEDIYLSFDDDEAGPIRLAYNQFVVRKLGEAGAADIEIDNAIRVLSLEAERRSGFEDELHIMYSECRDSGMSHAAFIGSKLVEFCLEPKQFMLITENYEDLPDNVLDWPADYKKALVKRFIASCESSFVLLDYTYNKQVLGALPPYINQFADWA